MQFPRRPHSCLAGTLLALTAAVPAGVTAAPAPAASPVSAESTSYTIGQIFGNQLHQAGFEGSLNLEALMHGVQAGLGGNAPTAEDRARIAQVLRGNREALANQNRVRAREFLAKNATIDGVQTTSTGLQYEVLAAGDPKAASPGATDRVTVRYRGRLLDGTQFDSSDQHGQATSFTLEGVIRGWREALMMMKPGASWRLYVPPELAYDANSPGSIPPGSLLIFDIDLVKVDSGGHAPSGAKPTVTGKPPAPKTAAAGAPAPGQ
jgi:FKBP-type peptidyl-prolyl cis-trans isomerase FklB